MQDRLNSSNCFIAMKTLLSI